ncbi:hypothetical protein GCM10022225_48550 [Plantactinospora mayteni]|uniref:Uncharacterized protein n=1 Tax=Plantactinospora mayteni TaxID=566021 RepID=A0ABQ4ESK9_9ACTN|nr:hypothetical protein [Plantactinospora mayteni]GIG97634.1 hypothetical protein Pma05_42070 [Plantactinospora mayteni]
MTVRVGQGSAREILVVLALAVSGLLLATLVAFTPWYGFAAGARNVEVVEMHAPVGTSPGDEMGLTVAGDG